VEYLLQQAGFSAIQVEWMKRCPWMIRQAIPMLVEYGTEMGEMIPTDRVDSALQDQASRARRVLK
jgi:hypothetical protein